MYHFANGSCHFVSIHTGSNDQRGGRVSSLPDGKECRWARQFAEAFIFAVLYHSDDQDQTSPTIFEVAADGLIRMEELSCELTVHNGNRRRLKAVAESYIATSA